MKITRKQAFVALVAGLVPWISRSAHAQLSATTTPTPLRGQTTPTQAQYDALLKRVTDLENRLASQVAFSKDASGNLTLNSPGAVSIMGSKLSLKASVDADLISSAALTFKGSVIRLN